MKSAELIALLKSHLTDAQPETEWLELKQDNKSPDQIGEYLSAIANAAALHGKDAGFIFWGVDDKTRKIVGTKFVPRHEKIGNEELENWLSYHLHPRINFKIHEFKIDDKQLVAFEIPAAKYTPVRFKEIEYIRVGTYTKRLKDYPEKEREMWAIFSRTVFEKEKAISGLTRSEIFKLLDIQSYFDLSKQSYPDTQSAILNRLIAERLLVEEDQPGHYSITNLGAILFAKDLSNFDSLARKAVRIITYPGTDRVKTIREQPIQKGYAAGFKELIDFVNQLLPTSEYIGKALRDEARIYPELTIRELVANAIIHQDFAVHGSGTMIEIFTDRIEITNPGEPLIETNRFLDSPPRSRNDTLASFMRRLNICEERGSGIDKVITQVERFQLPAPDFRVDNKHTRVVLFAPQPFSKMSKSARTRACYQHACLQHVSNQKMTNASLRKRFSFKKQNYPMASRIIADAIEAGLIKAYDSESKSRKHAQYIPFWA